VHEQLLVDFFCYAAYRVFVRGTYTVKIIFFFLLDEDVVFEDHSKVSEIKFVFPSADVFLYLIFLWELSNRMDPGAGH
jgi:hypothetical protein